MSTTNNWDAVCAMSLPQVNALLFQQYLRNGPTSPALPLRLILNAESQFWILDVVLGPPELSFQAGNQNATLEMELVRGSLIAFNPQTNSVLNAVKIRPKESRLTGPLTLAKMDVKDTLGSLVADLGAAAYVPKISGVDPASVLNTALGLAVQTYFANNETKFPIGTIAPAQVPASLQPTDFKFATQQKPGSSDACVLLLIQTNGSAGSVGPLDDYPIPANQIAALRVSARVLFNGVLPEYLNGTLGHLGTQFSGQQTGDAWNTRGSGGGINFGVIGPYNQPNGPPWSSDEQANTQAVVTPLDGFTVSASQGGLSAQWNCQPSHYWSAVHGLGKWWETETDQASLQISYSLASGQPRVDPLTNQVTFPGSGTVSVGQVNAPNWLEQLFGQFAVPNVILSGLQSNLQTVFNSFQLPSVNTFALANLLFPANHVISLTDAELPGDLNLSGTMVAPIAVTPANSAIAPGATVQFAAAGRAGSDVLWETAPHVGSISPSGLYTAPASLDNDEAIVVVVTAVSKSDPSRTGSAMVLIFQSPAAEGVDVEPGASVVTPSQEVALACTDSSGNALAVTWTLSPNIGQISSGWSTGLYTYTAPATVTTATQVTATAVNQANAAQKGSAVIQVIPTATVTVTPSTATAKPGAPVSLTATVGAGDAGDLAWLVYPIGAGRVAADPEDASKATYTAPNPAGTIKQARVVAYLVDDKAAGLGAAVITINS